MTSRTTSRTVTFRHPFMLDGFVRVQPAGSYIVDTEEELLDTVLFQAWKRVSTIIRLGAPGRIQDVLIDPEQLNNALLRDRAQEDSCPPLSENVKGLLDLCRQIPVEPQAPDRSQEIETAFCDAH